MKGKDKKALHSKTAAELGVLAKEKRSQLAKIAMDIRLAKVKNVHAAKMLRKEIAMIETIKRNRQLTEEVNNG